MNCGNRVLSAFSTTVVIINGCLELHIDFCPCEFPEPSVQQDNLTHVDPGTLKRAYLCCQPAEQDLGSSDSASVGTCWVLGRSGRALSSVEVSRIIRHLSCHEKSMSRLAQGRELLEECPGRRDRKCFKRPCEGQEVGGAGQVGERTLQV